MVGIFYRFKETRVEWAMSLMLLSLGMVFWAWPGMFESSNVYVGLARVAPQHVWSIMLIAIGGVRLAVLIVSSAGDFKWSSYVRGAASFISCFAWLQILLGFYIAFPIVASGIAIYPWLLLLDMYQTYSAAQEIAKRRFYV